MDTTREPEKSALRLAERLVELLGRGGFTATYKYAVLIALIDLCMEKTNATGMPPQAITTRELAEKITELYWPHCAPYDDRGVLFQSTGGAAKPALIVKHIVQFRQDVDPSRERSLSLSRARALDAASGNNRYEDLVREVEWTLINMPLPRLQRIGREEDRFLYDYHFKEGVARGAVDRYQRGLPSPFNNVLDLGPGVSTGLLALNGILRPLVFQHWTTMIADMNTIEQSNLEEFLFGKKRTPLDRVQPGLLELQRGLCFYCKRSILSGCQIDHFIPWARYADNGIDNLVAAHKSCNGRKSDFLAAAEHVERWRERSVRQERELLEIARSKTWEAHGARSVGVARAVYAMLPDDARGWLRETEFVKIDKQRVLQALSA